MKRVVGQSLSVLAAAIVGAALMPACMANNQSIFIRSALSPAGAQGGSLSCQYSADPGQPELYEGLLDAGVRDHYTAVLLVGNQLVSRGDKNTVRAESSRVRLHGAVVRVTEPDGAPISEFTSLGIGFLDPESGNTPAYTTLSVTVLDTPTVQRIASTLQPGETKLVAAHVKAFGETLAGADVESGEYRLPIRVCNGCLVRFNPDPAAPDVRCPGEPIDEKAMPCHPGQDEPVPCQLCSDRPACQ